MKMYLDVQNIDKNDKTHGGQYTRQSMNHILEKLDYFLKSLLITVKIIQKFHIIFHLESRKILKQLLYKKYLYAQVVMIQRKTIVKKGKQNIKAK